MIYTKTIGDRQVFDTCDTIRTNDGRWVSNPTAQQVADAGWVPYTPPEPSQEKKVAPGMDEMMEAVKRMLASSTTELSDEDALDVAALYPAWISMIGKEVKVGERYWYNEKLYKVVQAHIVQEDWTPDTVPALFTEVSIAEIPDWRQPTGAQDAYNTGDKVKHNDKTWESTVDGNVWEPGVYGWNEIV